MGDQGRTDFSCLNTQTSLNRQDQRHNGNTIYLFNAGLLHYDLLVVDTENREHGILVLVETKSWRAHPIAKQALRLRGESFRALGRDHKKLVLFLSESAFTHEYPYSLSRLIPVSCQQRHFLDELGIYFVVFAPPA